MYIGRSNSCVYKALYRHFHKWNDRRLDRVTYHGLLKINEYKVAVIEGNFDEVRAIEKALVIKLKPRDNTQFIDSELNEEQEQVLTDYDDSDYEYNECPF